MTSSVSSGGSVPAATSTATTTLTGEQVVFRRVDIIGGAGKFPTEAVCADVTANVACPTGFIDVRKVLVLPGAAALLAGLAI